MDMLKGAVIASLVLAAAGGATQVKVPQTYTTEVTKTKQVPVEKQVTKTRPVSKTVTVDLDYDYDCHKPKSDFDFSSYAKAVFSADVTNQDTEPGTFLVTFHVDLAGGSTTLQDRVYVQPGETRKAEAELNTDAGQDVAVRCSIDPGTKEITKTVQETYTETETVMEERQYTEEVTKTRRVPLYKAAGSGITGAIAGN